MSESSMLGERFGKLLQTAAEVRVILDSPLTANDREPIQQFGIALLAWLVDVAKDSRVLSLEEKLAYSAAMRVNSAIRVLLQTQGWTQAEEEYEFLDQSLVTDDAVLELLVLGRGCRFEN